jgi:hypothetical protein
MVAFLIAVSLFLMISFPVLVFAWCLVRVGKNPPKPAAEPRIRTIKAKYACELSGSAFEAAQMRNLL